MASSLERLSDNSSEGWLGEAASLEAFVSNDLTPEA
jgi:hypothetical protein